MHRHSALETIYKVGKYSSSEKQSLTFKELKSLVYEYRDEKENEIKKLNKTQLNLKIEIEDNQKNFEKLIDQAADEISNFV